MPLIQPASVLVSPHSEMKPGIRAGNVAKLAMPTTSARHMATIRGGPLGWRMVPTVYRSARGAPKPDETRTPPPVIRSLTAPALTCTRPGS